MTPRVQTLFGIAVTALGAYLLIRTQTDPKIAAGIVGLGCFLTLPKHVLELLKAVVPLVTKKPPSE